MKSEGSPSGVLDNDDDSGTGRAVLQGEVSNNLLRN